MSKGKRKLIYRIIAGMTYPCQWVWRCWSEAFSVEFEPRSIHHIFSKTNFDNSHCER